MYQLRGWSREAVNTKLMHYGQYLIRLPILRPRLATVNLIDYKYGIRTEAIYDQS